MRRGRKAIKMQRRRYGKWLVLGRAARPGRNVYWTCLCDCGNEAEVRGDKLRTGASKSCQSCAAKARVQRLLADPTAVKFHAWYQKFLKRGRMHT